MMMLVSLLTFLYLLTVLVAFVVVFHDTYVNGAYKPHFFDMKNLLVGFGLDLFIEALDTEKDLTASLGMALYLCPYGPLTLFMYKGIKSARKNVKRVSPDKPPSQVERPDILRTEEDQVTRSTQNISDK